MTPAIEIAVSHDAAAVAAATGRRLLSLVADAIRTRGRAHVVLTGGGVGTGTLRAIASAADRLEVDWSKVDLWWGDERFLRRGDPDRNETQARAALLDHLPIPHDRVHPMPAAGDGPWGDDPDAAASAYAHQLAQARHSSDAARENDPIAVPEFDVALLGVGPDGHVASLFPEHPDQRADPGVSVVGVRDSPKPPSTRVSLTFEAICRAREVWLLAAGAEKADAVAAALGTNDPWAVPASAARGTRRTVWMLDEAAAAGVPKDLRRG